MLSDGRVVNTPLKRTSCNACGYAFKSAAFSKTDRNAIYGEEYGLGLRDVAGDARRAAYYADQIEAQINRISGTRPSTIVEFGSGTGTLLRILAERLSTTRALGIEPAQQLVNSARQMSTSSIEIVQGFAETSDFEHVSFDVCYSVNVIEHTLDPSMFFLAASEAIYPDGLAVIICPDGEIPGAELLFFDHVSSFSVAALKFYAARNGLRLIETVSLTGPGSGFRLSCFTTCSNQNQVAAGSARHDLTTRRKRYLGGWRELGKLDSEEFGGPYGVFGIGEFTDLLSAYAPRFIENAEVFIADAPAENTLYGRPVYSTERFLEAHPIMRLLAAVNPRHWALLRQRFAKERYEILHPFQFCHLRTELQ